MSDQVEYLNKEGIVCKCSKEHYLREVLEFPDDGNEYSAYFLDGYLLMYRRAKPSGEFFLWEKRKCT